MPRLPSTCLLTIFDWSMTNYGPGKRGDIKGFPYGMLTNLTASCFSLFENSSSFMMCVSWSLGRRVDEQVTGTTIFK